MHSSSALGFDIFLSGLFGITIHSLLLIVGSSELGCQSRDAFSYRFLCKALNYYSGTVELSTFPIYEYTLLGATDIFKT